MKKLLMGLVGILLIFTLIACSSRDVEKQVESGSEEKAVSSVKLMTPAGAPTLSLIKMFEENPKVADGVTVEYESVASNDVLSSKLLSEDVDIAIVPTNLAASLYNRDLPYRLVGSNIWGLLYLVSDEEIASIDDLEGEEVYTFGRGLTPDVVFRHIVKNNGLDPETDMDFNYVGGGSELAPILISGQASTALIPEPMLSKVLSKRADLDVVIDIQEEWRKVTGIEESYPQTSIVVKSSLIEDNPDLVESILSKIEESCIWVNENPSQAGSYLENVQEDISKEVVENSIDRVNIEYRNAEDSKVAIESYLKVLLEDNPESVGGKLPDEDFYYKR